MIEDKIGLVDWEIAIAKNLLAMAAQHSFLLFRGKGNGKLAF